MGIHRAALGTALLAAVLLIAAIARASTTGAERTGQSDVPVHGNFSLEKARAVQGLDLYFAGESIAGHPLTAVERRDDSAAYVSFLYGDCAAGDHYGCALPVEIQVWPACARRLALYDPADPFSPRPEKTLVRGAPAGILDDGRQLEVETATSTVVIFGESRALVNRAAAALRGVNNAARPGEPLRPAAPAERACP